MDQELNILLEKYYTHALTEAEENRLFKLIQDQPELLEEVKNVTLVDRIMNYEPTATGTEPLSKEYQSYFDSEKGKELKEILSQQAKENNQPRKSAVIRYLPLIAAGVALFLVSIFLLKSNQKDLYSEMINYTDFPSITQRSTDDSQFGLIESSFKEQEFLEVISKTEDQTLLSQEPNLYLYRSIALAEEGEFEDALKVINTFINSDYLDAPKGYWYKALIELKMGEQASAKSTLQYITKHQLPFSSEAKKLLKRLN